MDIDSVESPDLEDSELAQCAPSKGVFRQMAMQVQQISGPRRLAISDKITSDRITTMLGHSSKLQDIVFHPETEDTLLVLAWHRHRHS